MVPPVSRLTTSQFSYPNSAQELVPALVESIKVAGLVLITDVTYATAAPEAPVLSFHGIPEGVDGILRENAILRFNETIDM